jgi:acetolactate synthase-1/2/3 large subunit
MPAHGGNPIRLVRADHIPTVMTQLAAAIATENSAKCSPQWRAQMLADIGRRLPWQDGPSGRHPARVTESLQAAIARTENAILVADGGEFCQWVQAGCVAPRRLINGPSGAIGGGIAYAIGTSIACPEATVFLVMGDGTAGFYFAELNNAVRAGCNIVALIGNDLRWNAEVQIQIDTYGLDRVYGCDLDASADYAAAASGLGLFGRTVCADDDLDKALADACAHDGPALLNVLIDGVAAPKFMPMKL